ncbi:hypothetical protein FH972_025531 [Carpinus fangiana]|uniref:Uncharacterized protein n=1 Tax=Carpinus fangiana TaxID=176857 RepID=A0A5N6L199_9ROSI|nr:hypothetical protein FH972_025531 [Carpinus fangiana]
MANVEEDEAGRLRAFRRRFGRGWDARSAEGEESLSVADAPVEEGAEGAAEPEVEGRAAERRETKETKETVKKADVKSAQDAQAWGEEEEENLMDLISAAGLAGEQHKGPVAAPQKVKAGKGKRK